MCSSSISNESLQADEIEALFSIFGSDWKLEDEFERAYSIKITNSSGNSVYFKVILPEDYPLSSPPKYLISAPWMNRYSKDNLNKMLDHMYGENIGECVLYQWILKIQDFIDAEHSENQIVSPSSFDEEISVVTKDSNDNETLLVQSMEIEELPPIFLGEPIIDRKSIFQGHASKVVSVDQMKKVLSKIKENKKVASATHNIVAYRISRGSNNFIQDCDDDGESKGGSVLLHLLELVDAVDVLAVVTRWYGGIHLGPDRFRHISNAARSALLEGGFINEKPKSHEKKHHKS